MRQQTRGVVLAGGPSRLGDLDRARIDLGDGPLLGRTLHILDKLCADRVVVGIPERHADFGAPVLTDERPGCGPLSGLETALRASPHPFVLLLACDLPFLRPPLVRTLRDAPALWDVVLPARAGQPEPLCARYATRCLESVTAALDRGERAMTAFHQEVSVHTVDLGDMCRHVEADDLFNLNTPDDLRRARELVVRRSSSAAGAPPRRDPAG